MDELLSLISHAALDEHTAMELNEKFQAAIKPNARTLQKADAPQANRQDSADFGQLLFMDKLDKRSQKKNTFYKSASVLIRFIIALLLILLGFGMIIMPAPPYFEMFTLFYLNPNDGVTIMDVVSLIVVFTGVYLMINMVIKIRD